MKKQSTWMYLVLAALAMTACTNENDALKQEENETGVIQFVMSAAGGNTRTITKPIDGGGVVTSFVDGDEVGMFALKTVGDKAPEEVNKNSLYKATEQEDKTLFWHTSDPIKAEVATFAFQAYYPYHAINTDRSKIVHSILPDQSVEDNYNKSDLLAAMTEGIEVADMEDQLVQLNFSHQLAMVQVTITGTGVKESPRATKLLGLRPEVALDFTTKEDPKLWTIATQGEPIDVTMFKVSESIVPDATDNKVVYRAVVPAQETTAGTAILEFTLGKYIYKLSHTSGVKYNSGMIRNINVTVAGKGPVISIDGENMNIDGWTDDSDNDIGGEADNVGDAPVMLASIPAIGLETVVEFGEPGKESWMPETGTTGWYVLAGKPNGKVETKVENLEVEIEVGKKEETGAITYNLFKADGITIDPSGSFHGLLYRFGKCVRPSNSSKYRLSFYLKSEGTNVLVSVFDVIPTTETVEEVPTVVRKKHAFSPSLEGKQGTLKAHNWLIHGVQLTNSDDAWKSYTIDFDLSQSTTDNVSSTPVFTSHSADFTDLTIAIGGGRNLPLSIANVTFEPVTE